MGPHIHNATIFEFSPKPVMITFCWEHEEQLYAFDDSLQVIKVNECPLCKYRIKKRGWSTVAADILAE